MIWEMVRSPNLDLFAIPQSLMSILKNSYKPVPGVMTRLKSLVKPFQYQGCSAGWEILGQFTHIQA